MATGKNAGKPNSHKGGKPTLKIVSVQFAHTPENEYRFKKLFDLLLRSAPVKEVHESGKTEQRKGTEGEDTLC